MEVSSVHSFNLNYMENESHDNQCIASPIVMADNEENDNVNPYVESMHDDLQNDRRNEWLDADVESMHEHIKYAEERSLMI